MSAPDASWSTAEVKRRLEEAALTLARLPDPDRRFRRRLTASWPAAPQTTPGEDFARGVERLKDTMPDERPGSRLVVTDPGAVERMHDCIGWLAWIPDRRRRFIVWGRAAGLSTYRIRRALGFACHRSTIRRHANRGLKEIAAALNGDRPPAPGADRADSRLAEEPKP